jgi:hypothetical protein
MLGLTHQCLSLFGPSSQVLVCWLVSLTILLLLLSSLVSRILIGSTWLLILICLCCSSSQELLPFEPQLSYRKPSSRTLARGEIWKEELNTLLLIDVRAWEDGIGLKGKESGDDYKV